MANSEHTILVSLKIDGKLVATRELLLTEYSEEFINSSKLNLLMKSIIGLIEKALKDFSTDLAYKLVAKQ